MYIITVFLFNQCLSSCTVLYFRKKWFIVTNFTLPQLFQNAAILNFFPFPLGLRNSGVQLYHLSSHNPVPQKPFCTAWLPRLPDQWQWPAVHLIRVHQVWKNGTLNREPTALEVYYGQKREERHFRQNVNDDHALNSTFNQPIICNSTNNVTWCHAIH